MPIVHVSKIVPKGYIGITLWPFGIYVSEVKYLSNNKLINHEKIHWEQQKELGGILFYVLYLIEWFIKIFTVTSVGGNPFSSAYRNLAAEREANLYEDDYEYLQEKRKRYAWLKYIFKRP